MVKHLIEYFVSTFEFTVVFSLILTLFRLNPKKYLYSIFLVSILLCTVYYVQTDLFQDDTFAFAVQLICFVLAVKYIVQLPYLHSFIVGISGYAVFATYQLILVVLSQLLNFTENHLEEVATNQIYKNSFQLIESFLAIGIIVFLNMKKIGFTSFGVHVKENKSPKLIITVLLFCILLMQLSLLVYSQLYWLYILFVNLFAAVLVILYEFYKKNKKEIQKKGLFIQKQ